MLKSETARFTDRSGAEIRSHYLRAGAGPCVLLVHGVGMQASIWQPQIDALAARYDVVAYDMLGHGKSSLPPADASLADYAWQLLKLLDYLGIESAAIVGHSMGALVSLEFSLSHAARASSLVAMNAVFCRSPEQKEAIAQRVETLKSGLERASSDQAIARWFGKPVPDELKAYAAQTRTLLDSVDPTGYLRTYKLFASSDESHKDRIANLAIRSLFMTGECDQNSTPAMSETLARLAPRGTVEVLAGERHMMALTAAADVNRRLLGFLGQKCNSASSCA